MNKFAIRTISIMMVLLFSISPITSSAAWDRLLEENDKPDASMTTSVNHPYAEIKKAIKSYKAVNTDVVGWLKVPNTNINVPITYVDSSNDYYIYRDWKGQKYSGINYKNYVDTATYVDFRAKFGTDFRTGTSKNLVLYGHNWNNLRAPFVIGNKAGYTMFSQLPSYTSIDFAKANPHIYFSTAENEGIWRVFAVAYCELSIDFFYNNPNPPKAEYEELLAGLKDRSLYDFGVEVDSTDRIITLSTCTRQYGSMDDQRFIVVARLLRDGESEADKVTVAVNPDVKQPNLK